MSAFSYKEAPTVTVQDGRPNLNNDTTAEPEDVQPEWERHLKRAIALAVGGAAGVVPFLSPTSDALAMKVCAVIIGVGAALGITSRGVTPRK